MSCNKVFVPKPIASTGKAHSIDIVEELTEKDYYTKEEIDEKLNTLKEDVNTVFAFISSQRR